jgi:FkbM family methyltransferase
MISYSQNFEDIYLIRAVNKISLGNLSIFPQNLILDIGAWEPEADSVSLAFIKMGWQAILIEPQPLYFEKNVKYYSDNPLVTIKKNAVSNELGVSVMFVPKVTTGWSSLTLEHSSKMGESVEEVPCELTTLDELHQEIGTCYWILKIDAEGAEEKIISGWSNPSVFPIVVLIEGNDEIVGTMLREKGYDHFFFDGINAYFVVSNFHNLVSNFPPINVNDDSHFNLSSRSWLVQS